MEQKFEMVEKANKVGPIIIGILGLLYGVSPIDAVPDIIPVAGWLDDLVLTHWWLTAACCTSFY